MGKELISGKVEKEQKEYLSQFDNKSKALREAIDLLKNQSHEKTSIEVEDKLSELKIYLEKGTELTKQLSKDIEEIKNQIYDEINKNQLEYLTKVNKEQISEFLDKPYKVLPKDKGEAWVVVPRWIPFNVGWLHSQDQSYNVFVVNKYVDWISEIPDKIKDKVGLEKEFEKAKVIKDDIIEFKNKEEREKAWERYRENLFKRVGETRVKTNKGKEFDVVASIIEDGNLPFKQNPLQEQDLRPEPKYIELDKKHSGDFQERAWNKFKETGMIGVYWPPGAGKTFLGLYAGERIKGKKLVIVPSKTLKEQWQKRINKLTQSQYEWDIQTYQYFNYGNNLDNYQKKDLKLTIFDEVHHLPANTYSKLATLNTKYRIGLSASPYREDKRTEYIFALTGYPVGLNWNELIELGAVNEPNVKVFLYRTQNQKKQDLKDVLDEYKGKTLVYCDSIKRGKEISNDIGAPFIHGETRKRMEKIKDNKITVISRVGDEGISIENIDTVIEYDFLYGSRRQEAQRAGRVMHKEEGESGNHIVLMTDSELDKYEKRLYSLEEKGFQLQFERRK